MIEAAIERFMLRLASIGCLGMAIGFVLFMLEHPSSPNIGAGISFMLVFALVGVDLWRKANKAKESSNV